MAPLSRGKLYPFASVDFDGFMPQPQAQPNSCKLWYNTGIGKKRNAWDSSEFPTTLTSRGVAITLKLWTTGSNCNLLSTSPQVQSSKRLRLMLHSHWQSYHKDRLILK
ncbi:hypothetical protein KI387_021357, partial [Taxus chinensis]